MFNNIDFNQRARRAGLRVFGTWKYAFARVCFCLLSFPPLAVAADDLLSEQAYLQDFPVVLSATRLSQPLSDAPNAMTVIDRQMIKASGFRMIADLFRLVPGMYVGNAGANTPIISLNSVSDQYSRRMQVLIDGRSVYLAPFGGVDWLGLPLMIDDIERIEVVRGPAAASHGTNSFYGVINIITRDAGSVKDRSVTVNKGGRGISDVSASLGKAGERFDYRFSFGYRAEDGDNPQTMNDGSSNRLLNLRTGYRLNDNDSLEYQFGLNEGRSGMGTAGRDEDSFREIKTENDFHQLGWSHIWQNGDESKLTYYRINRDYTDPYKCINYPVCKQDMGYQTIPVAQGFTHDVAKSQRQELEFQNTTLIGTDNRTVWGGGARYDYVMQPLIFLSSQETRGIRFFLHDEWRVNELLLVNAGAMYEDDGRGHENTSPRVSFNYHLSPQHSVRTSISAATRNPVDAELNMTTAHWGYWMNGNTPSAQDIRPERIVSKELGYVGQFGALGLDGRLYYEKVRDIIVLDYMADPAHLSNSFKNLSEATFKGLDISAKYHWETGRLTLGYALQKTSCLLSAYPTQYFNSAFVAQSYQTEYLNQCSESVPAHSGSLLLNQQMSDKMQFSFGYYSRSKVRNTNVPSNLPSESQMSRVDLKIARTFGQKEKLGGGEIAVVLQNAFQDNYTGYGDVQQRINLLFKRRAYLTATFIF